MINVAQPTHDQLLIKWQNIMGNADKDKAPPLEQ